MKKRSLKAARTSDEDMRPEYDFSGGTRALIAIAPKKRKTIIREERTAYQARTKKKSRSKV